MQGSNVVTRTFQWKLRLFSFLAVFSLSSIILAVQPITRVVDVLNDESTDTDGKLSLREAIASAVSFDVIEFDPNLFQGGPQTIVLTEGELGITTDIQILGPGSDELTISANAQSRVFSIAENISVELWNMTIANGKIVASETVYGGGGIINRGSLLLHYCVIDNNEVVSSNSYGGGGAGVLNITDINAEVGATLNVDNCTFSNNSISGEGLGTGGGICNITYGGQSARAWIYNSAFIYNSAIFNGSAIGTYLDVLGDFAFTQIVNSTISGNTNLAANGAIVCDAGWRRNLALVWISTIAPLRTIPMPGCHPLIPSATSLSGTALLRVIF